LYFFIRLLLFCSRFNSCFNLLSTNFLLLLLRGCGLYFFISSGRTFLVIRMTIIIFLLFVVVLIAWERRTRNFLLRRLLSLQVLISARSEEEVGNLRNLTVKYFACHEG
jgi:hypothetical protein